MGKFWNRIIGSFILVIFAIIPSHAQWVEVNYPTNNPLVYALASIGTDVFASSRTLGIGGVYLSTDNGISWTNTNLPTNESPRSLFANGPNLFAGTIGIYLSTDSGKSWAAENTGLRITGPEPIDVRAFAAIGTNIFAGSYNGLGVFLSSNNGSSWVQVNNGLSYDPANASYGMCNALAAMGTNLFAAMGGDGIYRSTDSGKSWINVSSSLIADFYALEVIGTNLFAGSDYGVALSTDSGQSWTAVNNGLPNPDNLEVVSFATSCSNLFAGIFDYGVFRSADSGKSWGAINNGLTVDYGAANALVVNASYLFTAPWSGSDSGGIWRLPLDEVVLDENPSNDTVPATLCTPANFSFDLQTIGGCTFPTLDSVFIAGLDTSQYQILRTHHTASENVPDTSWVTVNPTHDGIDSIGVTARYIDDQNNVLDTSFTLVLNVSPAQSLSVYVNPAQMSDTNQGTVSIPIYASGSTPVTGGSVLFRIDMRTDLLTPESISSTIPGAGTASLQVDDSGVWITLTLPPNVSISTDTLIATLVCRAYVTDTNETAISVATTSPTLGASNCLSIQGTGGASFTLIPQCGDATLTEFLGSNSSFRPMSIVPNPATNIISISNSSGPLTIADPLGRSYEVKQSGTTLDISSLPSGVYFISDGHTRTKFVKE